MRKLKIFIFPHVLLTGASRTLCSKLSTHLSRLSSSVSVVGYDSKVLNPYDRHYKSLFFVYLASFPRLLILPKLHSSFLPSYQNTGVFLRQAFSGYRILQYFPSLFKSTNPIMRVLQFFSLALSLASSAVALPQKTKPMENRAPSIVDLKNFSISNLYTHSFVVPDQTTWNRTISCT